MAVEIPRPERGEGQWGFGYREPLNMAEQNKKDQNPLFVRERIDQYAASGWSAIPHPDLRSRFRWYGLYTQRPEADGFFMLRIRIPGGRLTSEQAREIGRISQQYGRDVADVTDRQNVQLHWIRISDVPRIFERLAAVGLDTTEACGDTPRNILGCPLAGVDADEVLDSTELIYEVNARLVGDPEFSNLPRKYKGSITGCRHQCGVHEIMDFGLVGHELDDGRKGYDVWVGGGLSSTPHFGQRLGVFVTREEAPDVVVGITALFRDYGYRRSRNHARLKFLVADWGAAKFRQVLEEIYLKRKLSDGPAAKPSTQAHRDHTGVGKQRDGRNYVGFATKAGRITGSDLVVFADLAETLGRGRLGTTVEQKVVILDIPDARLGEAMDRLDERGYPVFASPFRTGTMACTGIEFCKLSIVETKGRASWLYSELERRLPSFDEQIRLNVTGCPWSCARAQIADIGFIGSLVTEKTNGNGELERLEGFNVHVGGRLGDAYAFGRKIPKLRLRADELPSFVERMLRLYESRRNGVHPFGAWIASLSPAEVVKAAQTAAHGLERVGPKPVSTEQIRLELD